MPIQRIRAGRSLQRRPQARARGGSNHEDGAAAAVPIDSKEVFPVLPEIVPPEVVLPESVHQTSPVAESKGDSATDSSAVVSDAGDDEGDNWISTVHPDSGLPCWLNTTSGDYDLVIDGRRMDVKVLEMCHELQKQVQVLQEQVQVLQKQLEALQKK